MASGQQAVAPVRGLQVNFGPKGLEQLTFHGAVLADTSKWPQDTFRIEHMKAFDSAGQVKKDGQYGWGGNNDGQQWDAADKSWTTKFDWGSIKVAYRPHGDALDVVVTEANKSGSGIVFDGASIVPIVLHLPRVPHDYGQPGDSRYVDNQAQPGVMVANFSAAEVVAVELEPGKPAYTGFQALGTPFAYAPIVSGTEPDGMRPGNLPGRMLKPGEADSFTVSLRFTNAGAPPEQVAGDAYKAWASRWPETLAWKDRRIIGTVFLASSPQGEKTRPAGFPLNPRRYFTDATVDVKSPAGLARFQRRVLKQADDVVANLKRLQAQGAITWDVEGEEYPQDTSYACAPDEIAKLSPEMESRLSGGPYAGMKLDDAYFKTIHDAGFRVGVCVRPQRLELGADGTAHQVTLPDAEVPAELIRKMRFAHDRWGATIFYLDSTVEQGGETLPPGVLEEAAKAMPDSLLIPEESDTRMYRATAPFQTFLFHNDLGTKDAVRDLYPHSFSANLVNDVDPAKLAAHRLELEDAVRRGDILMVLAGYWQANSEAAVEIYRRASVPVGR